MSQAGEADPDCSIVMTGWAMSAHEQHLMISTQVRAVSIANLQRSSITGGGEKQLTPTPDTRSIRLRLDRSWCPAAHRDLFPTE